MKKGTKTMMMLLGILLIVGLIGCTNHQKDSGQTDLLSPDLALQLSTHYPLGLVEYTLTDTTQTQHACFLKLESEGGTVYPQTIALKPKERLHERLYLYGPCRSVTLRITDTDGNSLNSKTIEITDTPIPQSNDTSEQTSDKSSRAYGYFKDGLYIKETQTEDVNVQYYSMALINNMSTQERSELITKILQAQAEESWFVLAITLILKEE